MTARTCHACHTRPVNDDRYACTSCVVTFRQLITNLPGLLDDLAIAASRQARFTDEGPRLTGSSNQPLPYDPLASDIRVVLLRVTIHAMHHACAHRGEAWPAPTHHAMAHYLDVRANWFATHHDGADHLAQVTALMRRAYAIIDRPPDRTYVGPCTATITDPQQPGRGIDCATELYTTPGRDTVTCPRCHHTYPVQERREWLLDQSWEAIATGPEIVRALAGHAFGNIHINLSTLRNWATKGPNGEPARLPHIRRGGKKCYRLGDVVTLATGSEVVDNAATCTDTQVL